VDELILDSARIRPELQICDVLSNASHGKGNGFPKLKGQPRLVRMLAETFGEYNQTMVVEDFLDRVDTLVKEYSYGLALITLVEHLIEPEGGDNDNIELRNRAKQRLDKILDCLVRVGVRGRDPQLAVLVSWLDQIIGQQRLPEKGYELATWLQNYIALPLRQKFTNIVPEESSTLDWFEYSLHRWALTAANHRGALIKAATEVQAMKHLEPSLATQWERAPLLMEGFIVQAVHQMDCFDFEHASSQIKLITESLKSHSKLLNEHLITNLPNQIHFDLRGKALGTLVQSETLAYLTEPNSSRLAQARAYSDEAIAEFSSAYDRVRQYQYRCQLETVAGNFDEARQYLSRSLSPNELPDLEHTQIANAIENLADTRWIQGFALLHWLRLGAAIGLNGSESDRQGIWYALDNSNLLDSYWCERKNLEYPVHSILRYVALIQAVRGNWDQALLALNKLHEIDPISSEYLVLGTILLAAQTEIAALLWEKDQKLAQDLIDNNNPNMYGAKQLLLQIQEKSANQLRGTSTILESWTQRINELLADNEIPSEQVKDKLLELSRMIGY
jgi:tetratricopeptide (TPR) repeat protein